MDALAGLSDVEDSESGSSSGSEEEEEGKAAAAGPAAKRQKQQIDLETLKQHGYKGGPSVLFVPDKQDDGEQNWAWYASVQPSCSTRRHGACAVHATMQRILLRPQTLSSGPAGGLERRTRAKRRGRRRLRSGS